jgi:transposase
VAIVFAGLDVHRAQITFDALDTETGEVQRGRIDAAPGAVVAWTRQFSGRELHVALEATTGWLFVCRALERAGAVAHLAEPWETRTRRGRKRAKTDREDARHLRQLLCEGRLPEAWIPPEHVREWRSRARLRKTLIDERTAWLQRVHATLFHHGIQRAPARLMTATGRPSSPVSTCPRMRRTGSESRSLSSRRSITSSGRLSSSSDPSPAASQDAKR